MPAAAAAAAVAANSAAHQPCVAAAGSRRQPGPHSQSATCWRPDEEGTWSRSAWCPTAAAAAVGGAWESWSGWRGGREERLFLVKLLRGGRDGTQMGCSGLAPSPKSRLRGALAQSLCAFSAASPSTPLPSQLQRRRLRPWSPGVLEASLPLHQCSCLFDCLRYRIPTGIIVFPRSCC